jgi:transcriptional regulator with XRE-family HTH domain
MDAELTFGAWLKRRRRVLDMTQADLAGRTGCAIGTIRRLESDDLGPSRQIAERLAAILVLPATAHETFIAFGCRRCTAASAAAVDTIDRARPYARCTYGSRVFS